VPDGNPLNNNAARLPSDDSAVSLVAEA